MPEKTLVLKVEVDKSVESVLDEYANACSQWLNRAFRLLYSDKRHNGSKVYGRLIKPHTRADGIPTGKFRIDNSAYKLLVSKKDAPTPIQTDVAHRKNIQALMKKVLTVWGGFLGPSPHCKVPHPKGHLPKFRPACYVGQQLSRLEDDGLTISFPYPLVGRPEKYPERVSVTLVSPRSAKYGKRLDMFRQRMRRKQRNGLLTTPSFEIKRHDDGKWYVHVPVEDDRPQVVDAGKVLGVDLGERNTATTALVTGPKGRTVLATKLYSGLSARHALDLLTLR